MSNALSRLKAINMTELFLIFTEGSSLEDIAAQFHVPVKDLKDVARREKWSDMALRCQENNAVLGEALIPGEKLKANREENLRQAEGLRSELDKTIREITADGAMAMPPATLQKLTKAASDIHDLTYRALGDKDKQKDAGQGGGSAPAAITINLPGAIQQPRQARGAIDV